MDTPTNAIDSTVDAVEEVPTESDDMRSAREEVASLRLELDATAEDDPDRYKIMYQFAVACGNYHENAGIEGEGELPLLVELVCRAENLAPKREKFEFGEDDFRGMSINTQMTLCRSLYQGTGDLNWLTKAIDAGERLMQYMQETKEDMHPVVHRILYSNRCERLANAYFDLYCYEGSRTNEKAITNATRYQAEAADYTVPEELTSGGQLKKWNRVSKFVDMKVMQFDLDKDESKPWDRLVSLINYYRHDLSSEGDDASIAARLNYYKHIELLTRRWVTTRENGHFDDLLDHMQERAKSQIPNRSYYDEKSREYLLRLAAKDFTSLTGDSTIWVNHVPSIDAAIALWQNLKPLDNATIGNVYRMLEPVAELQDLHQRRYNITRKALDGWAFDDMATAHSRLNFAVGELDKLEDSQSNSERGKSIKPWRPDPSWDQMSWKTSIIEMRESLICDAPSMDFTSHRLQFLRRADEDKNWKPTMRNWVRERTEDGEYVLGGAVQGRDDDVLEYVRRWDADGNGDSS